MQGIITNISALTPFATAFAFVIFVIYQFLKSKKDDVNNKANGIARDQGVASDVINTYREQVSQLREQINKQSESFQSQISALTGKIGELTGQLNEKNKQLDFFQQLFENRNPELEEFIKSSKQAAEISVQYMKSSTETLTEIHGFMKNLNEGMKAAKTLSADSNSILHTQAERDANIDESTKNNEGNITRIKIE